MIYHEMESFHFTSNIWIVLLCDHKKFHKRFGGWQRNMDVHKYLCGNRYSKLYTICVCTVLPFDWLINNLRGYSSANNWMQCHSPLRYCLITHILNEDELHSHLVSANTWYECWIEHLYKIEQKEMSGCLNTTKHLINDIRIHWLLCI